LSNGILSTASPVLINGAKSISQARRRYMEKKTKKGGFAPWVIGCIIGAIAVVVVIGILVAVCVVSTTPSKATVKYEVTGSAKTVDVTINNATGGTEQFSDVSVPWTHTISNYTYSYVSILAQNKGATGSVTVNIYVNGDLFKTSTSTGAYVIAQAGGFR
jgi:hypothetical protein